MEGTTEDSGHVVTRPRCRAVKRPQDNRHAAVPHATPSAGKPRMPHQGLRNERLTPAPIAKTTLLAQSRLKTRLNPKLNPELKPRLKPKLNPDSNPDSNRVKSDVRLKPCVRIVFVGRHRTVWKRLVVYLLTLGISRRVWLYRVNKEVDGHEALGLQHGRNAVLLCLPFLGPTWVAMQTSRRIARMTAGSDVRFQPWPLVYFPSWVPILGNLWYIAWTQDRLNRYWAEEKGHPEHGVDIDVDLEKDPAFLVELEKALAASLYAGSRFDQRKERREEVRAQRATVRAAGGSTPALWWRVPKLPAPRQLKVTCGRCKTPFSATQDPLAETPIVCWNCGLTEVLPSLRGNPLVKPRRAAVPTVQVTCGKCDTSFHAVRNLAGATELTCPRCGTSESLPPPAETATAKPVRGKRPKRR